MRIRSLVALTFLLAAPRLAPAQATDWGAAFRITPFIAFSPSFRQLGEATVITNTGAVVVHDVDTEFNSGFGMGVTAEVQIRDAFTIMASGMWSSRSDGFITDRQDEAVYEMDGTNFWIVKAGFGLRLRDFERNDMKLWHVNATIFAGPAIIKDDPKSESTTSLAARTSGTHTALNFGAEGELPIWDDRLALMAAAEDYMIFWNGDSVQGRVANALQSTYPAADVTVNGGHSHMWQFRFGVNFHF
jgi:hypothetical protein